jgi:hypothetical protein
MSEIKSLASGGELTEESFADFVARLKNDCVGAGVNDHCTADAIFTVEAKRYIYGLDKDYSDDLVILWDDASWENPDSFYDDHIDYDIAKQLDDAAMGLMDLKFKDLDLRDKFELIEEIDEVTVTGMSEQWVHVNSHFTKDAAEAFIKRKQHDYRNGLRVYVDAQTHCWEFNAIKKALIEGKLVMKND